MDNWGHDSYYRGGSSSSNSIFDPMNEASGSNSHHQHHQQDENDWTYHESFPRASSTGYSSDEDDFDYLLDNPYTPPPTPHEVNEPLPPANFGIMKIFHVDKNGNPPKGNDRWEADIDLDPAVHKVDSILDNPDNLVALQRRLPRQHVQHNGKEFARMIRRRCNNARALGLMHDQFPSHAQTWLQDSDGRAKPTPAVHAEYADTPESSTMFYSRHPERYIDHSHNAIHEDIKFFGSSPAAWVMDFSALPGCRIPLGYDLPLPTSQNRRLRRENLRRMQFGLRRHLLQVDYENFKQLHNRFKQGKLPRLLYNDTYHEYRLVKSKSHQQKTRLFTNEQIMQGNENRHRRMQEENLRKQKEENVTLTMNDRDSSDDEFQAPRQYKVTFKDPTKHYSYPDRHPGPK